MGISESAGHVNVTEAFTGAFTQVALLLMSRWLIKVCDMFVIFSKAKFEALNSRKTRWQQQS